MVIDHAANDEVLPLGTRLVPHMPELRALVDDFTEGELVAASGMTPKIGFAKKSAPVK